LGKTLSSIFLFLLINLVNAQQVKRYSFTHHGMKEGLASNVTSCVAQDEMGYIWIGTNNGLQRFDGVRYITFRAKKNDPASIPNNGIVQILFDKKNNLWIITADQKVGIFDTHNFIYREQKLKLTKQSVLNLGEKLICDEDGNILLLFMNGGYITWNEKKQEFSAEYNFIPLPDDWKLLDITQQPGTKKYWIGTRNGSVLYDLQTKQLSYTGHNVSKNRFIETLGNIPLPTGFLVDKKQRLWFFSWASGLPCIYVYDLKNEKLLIDRYNFYPVLNNYFELGGFLQQKNGTIWVRGLGIFARYVEGDRQFELVYNGYENEQSIAYNRVDYLYEDREENIWVVTNTNGLYQFNPSSQFFTNIRHTNRLSKQPSDGSVMSFINTRRGTYFVGTWSDGLYELDKNFRELPVHIKGLNPGAFAWCLSFSPDSNLIWMGAQPGIFCIDQKKQSASFYNPPIMEDKTVRQIVQDKFGNLWMGTQSLGLFKWTNREKEKKLYENVSQYQGIPPSQIFKISIDKKGYVWVCTSNYGLYVIDPATDKIVLHFGTDEPAERKLFWKSVVSALQYNDSIIAIAANAIYLFNTNQQKIVKKIDIPETIPGFIAAMEKDSNGYLWISSTNGILRLNPKNEIFIQFDRTDGIANDYFIIASSYVLPDGKIFFGADNQFVVFDPHQVRINDPAPDVAITGFKLMNKNLLLDSLLKYNSVKLAHKDNSIAIEFSGLSYSRTYSIHYKLEGLDKEWKRSDKSNQAIYTYLPPGKYTFLAKTENAEGISSKHITRLSIIVQPPFWKTWWFFGLVVFAITALLFWLDKLRMQKIRATESIRTRIATSLTEDMTNSLSSINISSELAKIKIDTDQERTKDYITQISETSNRMVEAMYDMVWSIDPKNDTMLNTIERMKSFAVETENLYDIDIVFDIDEAAVDLNLDMAKRYELLSVFKEAISNVVKHGSAKHVQVSLRLKNSRFFMMIEDDGKGFDLNKTAFGRGMNDMRRRAEAIRASIYFESEKNTGTIVKLEMPV
jgi:signal transduction histidine kinase/ligand-binding sensor domain-containing protein